MTKSTFHILEGFVRSANWLAARMEAEPPQGDVTVEIGDARRLSNVCSSSVDAVISSPPYLNAIDYMRGHRLSLVWLGHTLSELRSTRAASIGSERGAAASSALQGDLLSVVDPMARYPARLRRIVGRYAVDMFQALTETQRVLRPGGRATLIVGNSCVRGTFVENAFLISTAAQIAGLSLETRTERPLPASKRYLPPPREGRASTLDARIRTETILTFRKGRDAAA